MPGAPSPSFRPFPSTSSTTQAYKDQSNKKKKTLLQQQPQPEPTYHTMNTEKDSLASSADSVARTAMKLDFRIANLCGTVYKQGNLLFTPDGNSVLSPVGNRVTVFDLVGNKSLTLPFENRKNISRIALSPNGALLLTVDEDGQAMLVNFPRKVVLHHFNFKSPVRDIVFSPDNRWIAVTIGKLLQIWRAPGFTREFAPFVLFKTLGGHYDTILSISWSADSSHILTTSKDMTVRIYEIEPNMQESEHGREEHVKHIMLSGHRHSVLRAWWGADMSTVYSVSKDGSLFIWKKDDGSAASDNAHDANGDKEMPAKKKLKPERPLVARPVLKRSATWRISERHYFKQGGGVNVVSAAFHSSSQILVIGLSNGVFGLWELPDFTNIHTLSISSKKIDAVAINPSGEWLAFGSSKLGQLLVWEWQSESYVLKQQGHRHDMSSVAYSPDGQFVATGGDDGKLKIWSTLTGFCHVTFTEHTSGIEAVEFAKAGQVVFTASLDGTIRAFDLIRYRNFKTFTSPNPVQFSALAVDPSGEVVVAGSRDSYEVFVWSVSTGRLLDVLSGHTGPISGLVFSPIEGRVASCSWDRTVRLWDVFSRNVPTESFDHQSEVLALAYRPDGRQLAASTLDGQISFWDVADARQVGSVEGRRDISGGRKATDRTTSSNSAAGKSFTSLCYTVDGSAILAGGNSKYVCIYDTSTQILLEKFQISHNLSLDGIQEFLNSKNMTEAGPIELIQDDDEEASDLEDRMDASMPGVSKGDMSLRGATRPEARTRCVRFAPTGRSWAGASTEGLLLYSLDETLIFDPYDLDTDITPEAIHTYISQHEYLRALVTALRLGEHAHIKTAYDAIPSADIELIAAELPPRYLERLLRFVVVYVEQSGRVEFHLAIVTALLQCHARYTRVRVAEFGGVLRGLAKGIGRLYESTSKLCNENTYALDFVLVKLAQSNDDGENQDIEMLL
ncbi:hypothetical protein SmJEL517_g04533 [Synchytrium microbalum]|uniref:Small-subunit processome Utp12 domain-containing protein n=1 Tax=Synchytrium microbalum TaxID=1806994 RepID=A0A507BTS3_9FUNG|nr:uncharacterized protein SmJEL517_g04533 [Synchytrium microbalum]TPX32377.1 hypothetical protein SmJEL517_g04533 [Synchytrium microbalum]